MRLVLALAAGAAVAAFSALILGEYEFKGSTPYVAGLLFGLLVAETVLAVAKRGSNALAGATAVLAGGGLAWAAWISAGRDWSYVPDAAWLSVGIGVVVGAVRVARAGVRSSAPPADDSRPEPAPAPDDRGAP